MKVKSFPSLIVCLLLTLSVYSQPAEITYLGTTIREGSANDVSYGPYSIGFSFTFFGNAYSEFYVSSNGLLTFGGGSALNQETNIPSATLPDNFIAPFWDDLKIDGFGNILYRTIGVSPNRKLVVQFRNMGFYPSPTYMGTFSVILYETTNVIQTQYRMIMLQDVPKARGGDASIGIENSNGTSGYEFAYHNSTAVQSWKAISYTPSGPSYTVNGNAVYDGIYLTKNLTLPEPGIADLISPANASSVGVDFTFEWGASEYAETYYLRMANNAEMTGASTLYSGPDLIYTATGLTGGQTYYWTVLTSNTTGFTWNEVKKFTVSVTPPLTSIPLTAWVEQGYDKTIKLNYTGGDAGPKSAVITALPVQGQLFQYSGGIKGSQISSVPTTITDPARNVIYTAPGSSGNGIGNFNFKMNDGTGDSPEATITVHVSPPGIPDVLYVAKSSGIEIQFNRTMADPAGKHSQFTATVNGSPATIASASLKTGDAYSIVLTLSPALTGTETVLLSYTQGDITSVSGGFLLSFNDQPVTLSSQTFSFAQSLDKTYGESPFNLTATASSGLGITYASSNLGVATTSGNIATINSAGVSAITALQAGNASYAPAKFIRTMTVSKADQAITFGTLPPKITGDSDFSPGATASSGLVVSYTSDNSSVATILGSMIHITGPGEAVITGHQPGNSNYNAATEVSQNLSVSVLTDIDKPLFSENIFKIYFLNDQIHIQTIADEWNNQTGSVRVFDISGNPAINLRKVNFNKDSLIQIPISGSAGFYIVEIRSGIKRFVGKAIVK